jgi:dihydroorotate dehydrogenase (fumarate)
MSFDMSTDYLGLRLRHPVMPGASPLADDLDNVRRLEDLGAAAICLRSLFEEQLTAQQMSTHRYFDSHDEGHAEALDYFPATADFVLGPDAYLEHIAKLRESVDIPVIGSLNGVSMGGWLEYASGIEQAGASALELNMYTLASDPDISGATLEARQLEIVRAVIDAVSIPVAVKLSPFYSALPHFVNALEAEGVAGVILFNRLYEPDIDPEELELDRRLYLSTPAELLLRLRWLAILSSRTRMSLACSGGVHTSLGALKAIMAGASGVQMVSALLRNGIELLGEVIEELYQWFDDHGYDSVEEARGSMDDSRAPNPSAYERANYVQLLHGDR